MNVRDFKETCKGLITYLVKYHLMPYKQLYREIQRTQWLSAKELEAYQLIQLKRVVKHAYETVPYYTEMMDHAGIRPEHIQQLADLSRFPIMTKRDMIQIGSRLVSTRYNKLFMKTAFTGGSSGLPVPVRRDISSIARENAFVKRQYDWAGVQTSDPCAYLEGRIVAPVGQNPTRVHFYDAVMRALVLSTFHLRYDLVPHYIELIKAYKIKSLIGYPSAIYILAKGCADKGLSLNLRCVLTTSETLDEMKKTAISNAFHCPVFDFYGSAERVVYIHTCDKGSYHVIPDYGFTELIPAESPNEDCFRIVSTGFWNMTMPLIRYQMGDLVKYSSRQCACKRAFPVIDKIVGREGTIITTPSGVQLGASSVEYILERILQSMYHLPIVTGRVLQKQSDLLTLEFVPAEGFDQEHEHRLMDAVRRHIPDGMRMEIRRVEQLERTARGKYLSFVMAEHH
jgi:phenylacetate-CoA ligase